MITLSETQASFRRFIAHKDWRFTDNKFIWSIDSIFLKVRPYP